jgi:hypothetical protein
MANEATLYGSYDYRGSRYEILVAHDAYGPILAVPNFNTCMRLPMYWKQGMDTGYICEKLGAHDQLNEVDAEGIRLALAKLAKGERQ